MSIDKQSILLGDTATLTLTLSETSTTEPPEIPSVPDLDIRYSGARQESYSSFVMIVQGRQVEKKQTGGGYHFDYTLTPQRAGVIQVPSFSIVVDGHNYQTNPFNLEVYDQTEKSEDIFVDVSIDRPNVYLGEKVLVTTKWFLNKEVSAYKMRVPWLEGIKNFIITDLNPEEGKRYHRFTVNGDEQVIATKNREYYKGKPYTVITFQKYLTPISVGSYTLEPTILNADIVTGYARSRSRSVFDDFFDSSLDGFFGSRNSAVTEPFSTKSNALTISVSEVPGAQKPDFFSDGVGLFDFRVQAKPLRLKVGEPITFTMQVIGAGNIEQIKMPEFPEMEYFKSYEPENRVNVTQKEGQIIGEKVSEIVLVPKAAGNYEIPKINFSYFNPSERAYKTLSSGPFLIHVDPGVETVDKSLPYVQNSIEAKEEPKKEIKFIERDIQYIKTDLGPMDRGADRIHDYPAAWIISYILPIILLVLMIVWNQKKERLRTDHGFARHRFASKKIKRYLEAASESIEAQDARRFYDSLSKGMHQYLADKLNLGIGNVHIDDISEKLKAKGVYDSLLKEIEVLEHHCQMALFAATENDLKKWKSDLNQARKLIDALEKIL